MGNKFKVIHLAKNEAIIKGKKKGQVHYADTTQYNELKTNQAVAAAGQEMDDAIAAFFAPVVEAAEKFGESLLNSDSIDPDFTVVVREGVEGVEGVAEQVITLTEDTFILRAIESGNTSRLRWINGALVITKYEG